TKTTSLPRKSSSDLENTDLLQKNKIIILGSEIKRLLPRLHNLHFKLTFDDQIQDVLMFPPSLYNYLINDVGRKVILVLNKVDLVAPEVVIAWRHYFQTTYSSLPVVIFASNPPQTKSLLKSCEEIMINSVDEINLKTVSVYVNILMVYQHSPAVAKTQ
ncbi:hypothetical protein GQX74_010920, partial [Glossina fuscipes]